MTVILLRHAEPDWQLVNERQWPGLANDFAPLAAQGVQQADAVADALRGRDVRVVLSSPMTRAVQTAAVVAGRLALPLQVELDLREWLPDESYGWRTAQEVAAAYADMVECGGVRAVDHPLRWEGTRIVEA